MSLMCTHTIYMYMPIWHNRLTQIVLYTHNLCSNDHHHRFVLNMELHKLDFDNEFWHVIFLIIL